MGIAGVYCSYKILRFKSIYQSWESRRKKGWRQVTWFRGTFGDWINRQFPLFTCWKRNRKEKIILYQGSIVLSKAKIIQNVSRLTLKGGDQIARSNNPCTITE